MDQFEIVLKASLIESREDSFFYKVTGDVLWKDKFFAQKLNYSVYNEENDLVYSVPWYYGLYCNICVNNYNAKLFFNMNEYDKRASVYEQLRLDYWKILAEETGDKNWLTNCKTK